MGSGKSSVGRLIARVLRGRFVDTDRMVVDHVGRQITEIFASDGEVFFREQESAVLRSLLGLRHQVIATGGGIVTLPANGALLRQLGMVVWLSASEEIIWDRVSRNRNRPLLHTENPRDTIRQLLEKRNPLYEAVAEMKIDTTLLTHAEVAERICERLRTGN
ncbi:MAG TPA: shikimate kinase [Chthoniobacteraceae bacterium]|nr:shikimate kinase [Chthoniobacteraceae bacterium]